MTTETGNQTCRYFVTYSGVRLPFKLVEPIPDGRLAHRNTYIRAFFDHDGALTGFDKMVYGEVELAHRYLYHPNGQLSRAELTMDEETITLHFDETGDQVQTAWGFHKDEGDHP